jgi:hypothetical protein
MMDKRRKIWAAGFVAAAIVALILVSASLPQLQFHAGQPFWLPNAPSGAGDQALTSSAVDVLFLIFRAMLALGVVALPVYIVISLLTSRGRQRLLGDVIALALIILFLSLLSRSAQQPQDQKVLLQGLPPSPPTPQPAGPPAQFTAHVPPWLDVLAAPTLAIFISGASAVVLWWVWRRAESTRRGAPDRITELASRRTLDLMAEQAKETIGALRAGEAFGDAIIRSYVQLSRVVQEERAIQRGKAMTPYEFEQLLIQRGFPAQPVRDLTRLFERVRYGKRTASEMEERQAIASLEAIIAFCQGSGGG